MTTASSTDILDSLANYLSRSLKSGSLSLDRSQTDGRINSQLNERQISDALRLYALANEQFQLARYSICIAPPRFWYDFLVSGPEVFLPVNVKVSSLEGNDNLASKEGGLLRANWCRSQNGEN